MERLTVTEVQQIKAEWDSPYMCRPNDFWENRINSLFGTIEAQQQEIEQLKQQIEALAADKDEQAGRIMQYDTALKLACNDIAEKDAVNPADFEAINKDADYNYGYFMARADALLGGKEDV